MSHGNAPQVGESAPAIELPDDTGTLRRLSDERGTWLVVYFYPKDDTPGCTVEACEFRDSYQAIREVGAQVWGVSILDSTSKHAFKTKCGLPFVLLADAEHRVSEAYGAWVEKEHYGKRYWGVQRSTFLIDPAGRVARVWPKVKPEGHAAEVLAALGEERSRRGAGITQE